MRPNYQDLGYLTGAVFAQSLTHKPVVVSHLSQRFILYGHISRETCCRRLVDRLYRTVRLPSISLARFYRALPDQQPKGLTLASAAQPHFRAGTTGR